jgi:hypothetical protein
MSDMELAKMFRVKEPREQNVKKPNMNVEDLKV